MAGEQRQDPLAYGEFHQGRPAEAQEGGEYEGGERGIVGDTFRKLRDKYQKPASNDSGQNVTQAYQPHLYGQSTAQPSRPSPSDNSSQQPASTVSSIFDKLHGVVHGLGVEIKQSVAGGGQTHSHTHEGAMCSYGMHDDNQYRYGSFAAQRSGNDVKWYVDGCGYMWAVSMALEQARESIWILDWWLSPELYLRRPPSRNEQYRIDRMLQAAAQRGVKINIIVYKEVEQALTRKYLSPTLPKYIHSLLPRGIDPITKALSHLGVAATFASLEHIEAENPLITTMTVSSAHTKHALEDLHPNIAVFRHPDHLPDAQTFESSFISSLRNMSLNAKTVANLPQDALKALYGVHDDIILYWAHHEKLCLIDGSIAFMGGLDLCYGRWDTHQHPIADAHPSNLDDIIFPGQDFNNARIMDFQDVAHWENNKLDRKYSSRMGWSDISISLRGPVVEDLRAHFAERWNFIFDEKYNVRKDARYARITFRQNEAGAIPAMPGYGQPQSLNIPGPPSGVPNKLYEQPLQGNASYTPNPSQAQTPYFPPPPVSGRGIDQSAEESSTRGIESSGGGHRHYHRRLEDEAASLTGVAGAIRGRVEEGMRHVQEQYLGGNDSSLDGSFQQTGIPCQIVRSCTKWSHGVKTEHSIANAYISVIRESRHFVYIENQFFITATSDAQKPVKNKIGAAIVERILRAARAGQKFKVIVLMPAVPAFAGDLRDDSSLRTRAIMEFQYNSINRGGYSIMEMIAKEGYNPEDYIRFYNLRNYDRINNSASMKDAEQKSGVSYEDARREHDNAVELPAVYPGDRGGDDSSNPLAQQKYKQYQQATTGMNQRQGLGSGRWDTVSECYMLSGTDIREVPWQTGDIPEIKAFVSEELYVHSKVLIADDRVVICGSANLNDRSQLGDHDSEIAIVIEDPTTVDSYMNGQPYRAAKYATTLRRQLFRKHLGLIPPQDMGRPDQNFEPIGVPNVYEFGSAEDQAVMDPLSDSFLNFWNFRARTNTEAFGRIFHAVPHDSVITWKDYAAYYEKFFHEAGEEAEGKKGVRKSAKYQWGHVVEENFSPGEQGVREVKDLLSTIKGTLVEMPLKFLIKEDIAYEGISLNAFTEEVYT